MENSSNITTKQSHSAFELIVYCYACSDNTDANSILENSLTAKEKIISELNMELHNIETALSNEREQHLNEIKKLNTLLHEKVKYGSLVQCSRENK